MFGRPSDMREHVAEISGVTVDDLREVARGVARPAHLVVGLVGDIDGRTEAALDLVERWPGAR